MLHDDPKIYHKVGLALVVTTKNSYPAHNSFSSFQLVFGKQPKLPKAMKEKLSALEGMTTDKSLGTHIPAMHAGRKAFTEALYNGKVVKVLRYNVRAMERFYVQGEEMYYRRNNKRAKWHSLATPLRETQLIYFLVHQGNFVTVAGLWPPRTLMSRSA